MPKQTDSDQTDTANQFPKTGLRKFLFSAIVLLVIWAVFGQVVPRFMFTKREMPIDSPAPINGQATQPNTPDQASSPVQSEQFAALQNRLNQLEERIKTLESKPQEVLPALPANNEYLEDSMQAVLSQLNTLKTTQTRQVALLGAFTPLKDAIQNGQPYAAQLVTLQQLLLENDKAKTLLEPLVAHAEQGIPNLSMLKQSFATTVDKMLSAKNPDAGVEAALHNLVRIRKTGNVQGNDDEAILARAEAALGNGNLNDTVNELGSLSEGSAHAFTKWIEQANVFLQAQATLGLLGSALLEPATAAPVPPHPVDIQAPAE